MNKKQDTDTRQLQIAQAALAVIAEHGLKGMTLERIARIVGMVPSAIYRHFPGKDAVLDAVLGLLRTRLVANVTLARHSHADPLAALRDVLMRQIMLIAEMRSVPRVLFADEVLLRRSDGTSRLFDALTDFRAALAELVAEGQAQGRIRADILPQQAAVAFIGLYAPLAILWHATGGKLDLAEHAEANWKIFEQGIRPAP